MRVTAFRVVSVVFLLLLAGGAITIGGFAPKIVENIALSQSPVTNGSDSAAMYKQLPVNITQKIYMFNITNEAEFFNGATPIMEQLGPYTFISVWTKNMTWDGDQLKYNESRTFFFVPELSNGTLSDQVLHVDLVYLKVIRYAQALPWVLRKIAMGILDAEFYFRRWTVLTRHTVGELLYDGYKSDIAKYANDVFKNLPVIDGKIGFLLGLNGTADGEFSVYSGIDNNLDKLNDITSYKNSSTLDYYGDECNELYGTNGEVYAPFTDKPMNSISIFDKTLCRPWTLYFNSTSDYYGITEANYVSGDDLFTATGNETIDQCYEKQPTHMRGTFDASTCQFDQDIVLSLPHFLKGDERLLEAVEGLDPDITKHDFELSSSNLGIVTDMKIRVQINSFISSNPLDQKRQKLVYPLFWQELVLQKKDKEAFMEFLWNKAVRPKILLQAVTFGAGGLLVAIVVVLFIAWIIIDARRPASPPLIVDRGPIMGEDEVDVEPDNVYPSICPESYN